MQKSKEEVINDELRRFNSNYYRNRFRRLVSFLLLSIGFNFLLILMVLYLYVSNPKYSFRFYASNVYNGVLTKLNPLSSPVLDKNKMLTWTKQMVLTLYNCNFTNYQQVFDSLRPWFTNKGWDEFNSNLENSGLLSSIVNRKLFLTSVMDADPIILNDGVINGYYAWNLQMHLSIILKTSNTDNLAPAIVQHVIVNLTVIRVPNLEDQQAIAISGFSLTSK